MDETFAKKFWKLEVAEWLVLFVIIAYSVIFSYHIILNYYSFRRGAWDLGILVQSITSAIKGRFFINNVERYYSPSGSYFGVHFSPIMFILVPFFSLAPKVETIIVLNTVILALGALPVYLIAKDCLKHYLSALIMAITYLLNPSLQGIIWYDFTPQTFFPLFILMTTLFLKKRKALPFLFFTLLTLMSLEQAAYFIILYIFYVAWELRKDVKKLFSRDRTVFSLLPFFVFIIAIVWMFISSNVKHSINPNPPDEFLALGNFRMFEVSSIIEIPAKALSNPDLLMKAIRIDFPSKILYVVLTFAPSCFLAFLSPIALLPSFLWLFLALISNWPPYYQFGFHYPAFTLPFVVVATIDSISRPFHGTDAHLTKQFLLRSSALLLIVGLILSIFASPLSGIHELGHFEYFRDYGISTPSSVDNTLREILEKLPADAKVLTTNNLFSCISTNINAYVIPPKDAPSQRLYIEQLNYLKKIQYDFIVISSIFWDKLDAEVLYDNFVKGSNTYKLFMVGAGFEIYKYGYEGEPKKIPLRFSWRELFRGEWTEMVYDVSSKSGNVIALKPSTKERDIIWFGPYVTLTPGNYTVNFRIKVDKITNDRIIRLDVWSNSLGSRAQIAALDIYGEDFAQKLTWHTFTISFSVKDRTSAVEFRGLKAPSNVGIWLDYVEVIPE